MNIQYNSFNSCNKIRLYHDFEFANKKFKNKTAILYYKDIANTSPINLTYKSLNKVVVTINALLLDIIDMKHFDVDRSTPFIIGIFCKCPPVAVACMLGIMKHGAFFCIPEDLTMSELSTVIHKVQPAIFFIHKLLIKEYGHLFICYKELEFSVFNEIMCVATFQDSTVSKEKVLQRSDCVDYDNDIAYVMTTSGSTGAPKVVFVSHNCIVPNIKDFIKLFSVTLNDIILGASPLTFDPCIVDIFTSLSCGACLIMMPSYVINKIDIIDKIFNENLVTVLQATPTFINFICPDLLKNELLSDGKRCLKVLALGGEKFPLPRTLKQLVGKNCKTKIFNLYGITELSCWASYQEINILEYCNLNVEFHNKEDAGIVRSLMNIKISCPLGKPLSKTVIKVINDKGIPLENEIGNIVISGERAKYQQQIGKYYLSGNEFNEEILFTGDVGYFYNNQLYYIDRNDDILKRQGYKISLAEIESVAKDIESIFNCCAVTWQHSIYLYIVLKKGFVTTKEMIKKHMKLLLSDWKFPDEIIFVDELPISRNSKVDKQNLIKRSQSICNKLVKNCHHDFTMHDLLDYAQKCIEINRSESTDNFINIGGNSLQAIAFCNKIQKVLNKEYPLLLQTIFNGTFKDIYDLITNSKLKRNWLQINKNDSMNSVYRSNKCLKTDSQDISSNHSGLLHGDSSDISIISRSGLVMNGQTSLQYVDETCENIEILWKIDFEKCIDASPIIVSTLERKICFIGSHSHKFSSIDINSGSVIWTTVLPDRIESSAAVSSDIAKVYVGCYDGTLYCMNFSSGAIIWKYSTKGTIKCTPFVDHRSQSLYFGSYDKYLYCLHEYGELRWKYKISEGSIFSSPVIVKEKVYSATLDGYVSCNDANTGCCMWKELIGKPIFSSLISFSKGIVFGCVDHNFYCYSLEGKLSWKFTTNGPIFSSPFVLETTPVGTCISLPEIISGFTVISIGSHDHCIYLLNECGILLQMWTLSSPIYATPYLTILSTYKEQERNGKTNQGIKLRGVVCETVGTVVCFSYKFEFSNSAIHPECSLKSKQIGGQIFSSPVIYENRLLFGCRDNNLYCLNMF